MSADLRALLQLVVSEAVPVGDGAYVSLEASIINRARAALASDAPPQGGGRRPQRTNMWTNVNATNPHFKTRGW